jgi:hypothetical protein
MMTKEQLIERVQQLQKAVEQDVAEHHQLLGRLNECREQLTQLEAEQAIEPASPVI